MRGRHRKARLQASGAIFTLVGLVMTIFLALGQFGLVAASAEDRSRDGSFSSDTGADTERVDSPAPADDGGLTQREAPGLSQDTPGGGGSGAQLEPQPGPAAVVTNVTICHATSSASNPYGPSDTTVSVSSIIAGPPSGHSSHTGPVWPGANWGDIIPPFDYDVGAGVQSYPGLNWGAAGQAILANDCQVEAKIRVVKDLVPPGDPGTFNLLVDGNTVASAVGDGGSGSTALAYGTHTVSETGAGGTSLADYGSSISCVGPILAAGAQTVTGAGSSVTGTFVAGSWVCTITNTRLVAGLSTPVKAASGTANVGSTNFTYTVSTTNTGTANATNVTITDNVPAGLSVTSVTWQKSNPSANGTCTATNSVSCNVGTLAPNQSVTVTITMTVGAAACPSVSNTASVSADGIGPLTSNTVGPTAIGNCPAATAPDISIVKSGPASPIAPNTPFAYTLTVTNLGNATALGVQLSDTIPAGLAITSVTPTPPTCSFAGQVVSCTFGDIGAGGSVQVTVNVTPTTCGPFTNTATITTTSTNDTNPGNHSSTFGPTTVNCQPNLTINKSGPATVAQGGLIVYTVTVTNSGTAPATNVTITDDLDNALTGVTAQIVGGTGGGSCVVNPGQVVVCSGFGLAAANPGSDDVATITISATAPVGTCPTITNQATGTFGPAAPVTIPPSGVVTTTVTGCVTPVPALAIDKTASPTQADAGDPISFTITVQNVGQADAVGVTITDPLPGGLTWTASPGAPTCTVAAGNLNCNVGTLTPGASFSVTLTATSDPSFCGVLTNTATASAQNAGSVSDSAGVTLDCPPGAAGIIIDKTATPPMVHVGDTITYTFTVTLAPGSAPVSGVMVVDPVCDVPPGMSGPSGDGGTPGLLEPGETWTYSCIHVVTPTDPDPLPNVATVCADGPGGTVCDDDDAIVDVAHPDIELVKEADPSSGSPGDLITYTYTVTNSGDVDLFDVSVHDDVLGHICTVPVLHAGETVVCTGTYTIPVGAPAELRNIAIAGGTDPIGQLVEDEDDETITVVGGATVTPTKTAPGGVAFTGPAAAIPLTGLALLFLTVGTGLLWAGRRRGRHASMME